ncbi:CxC2 domain-containing protein [Mycena kentingensis (nom. inval.)]|nr:CxC2 domain-containing protein [Mycena kentingensis (nom. inval.)]
MDDATRKRKRSTRPAVPTSSHHHVLPLSRFSTAIPAVNAPLVTYVDRPSADRRTVVSEAVPIPPNSPIKRARREAQQKRDQPPPLALVDEAERYGMEDLDGGDQGPELDSSEAEPLNPKPADPAMRRWMLEFRDIFIRALLWREGRGPARETCTSCDAAPGIIRCRECFGAALLCEGCCIAVHADNPLHWVERWTGAYFARCTLRSCGLRFQVGHTDGSHCSRPRPARDDFVVVHENGIHEVAVDYCGCYHTTDPDYLQLLRRGWYPATVDTPRSCTTLQCLDAFQTLSLHGKTTAYDFYAALETRTNAVGIKPPDRYRVFLRVSRQYRHLMLLKRGGRGHDRFGVMGTAPGELALRCPACPRPGVNLPEGWENAPPEDRCLYTLVVAMDACFRLKRRLFSSLAKDPPLGPGWAFMVDPAPYRAWVLTLGEQTEMSSCSGLAAIDHANDKFSRGYDATGVGMGVCARHEFILPTAVADLQRGEKYGNMDYIFASFMRHFITLLWIIISYDIACQWHKRLKERLQNLPPHVRLAALLKLVELARFAIPKMHIKGHIYLCQILFALGLISGSGKVDGEGIERPWSMIGRRCGEYASTLLRRRLFKARAELAKQEEAFTEFSKAQAADVPAWMEQVHAYEADRDLPNPYKAKQDGKTEREVRDEFEEQEAKEEAAGRVRLHDVGPAEFLELLLRAESEQRRVHALASLKRAQTTAQKINMRRERRKINKSIGRIRTLQAIYMPGALVYLSSLKLPQETPAEQVPLLPPSALSESQRENGGCRDGLAELERKLRDAQCRSALAALRGQLVNKARLLTFKQNQSRHQGANTRSRARIAQNENKILLRADKYQAAHRALVALADGDATGVTWPALRREDIRCMDDSDGAGFEVPADRPDVFGAVGAGAAVAKGETRRVMSWIWRMTGYTGSDSEMRDALRIEWCKAYARTRRWREEVRVLEEDWRRLPLSLAFSERQWVERAGSVDVSGMDTEEAEGLIAYAAKQADVYRDLARRAEITRTARRLRRGQRRTREEVQVGPLPGLDGGDAEAAQDDVDGDDVFVDEEIEDFVDDLGNASDEEEEDEAYILDGDGYQPGGAGIYFAGTPEDPDRPAITGLLLSNLRHLGLGLFSFLWQDIRAQGEPNPYDLGEADAVTEAEVRKELEDEDRRALADGVPPLNAVSPSEFVTFGLDLEEQQRHIRVQAQLKRQKSSTGLEIRLKPLRKKLNKGLRRFRDLQATYTPAALPHLEALHLGADLHPEEVPLLLPSALRPAERSTCPENIVEMERCLRHARCKASLARLRHQLHVKARLLIYKKHQSRNQGMNTRSRALVARNESKIKGHADAYQASRAALAEMDDSMVWPALTPKDIRCLEDRDDISKREHRNRRQLEIRLQRQMDLLAEGWITSEEVECVRDEDDEEEEGEDAAVGRKTSKSSGESKYTISWIWTMAGQTGTDAALMDSLRVEWARAYARVRRWREENSGSLGSRAAIEMGGDARVVEGRVAYAAKQASVYRELVRRAEITRTEVWKGRGHKKDGERMATAEDTLMEEDGDEEADVAEIAGASDSEQSDDDQDGVLAGDDDDDDEEDEENY